MPKIKVLIVEDNPLIQLAYSKALSSLEDIEIVGQAKHGKEGLDLLRTNDVDVIVCDLNMPVMDGFEFTKIVMEENPKPILILSDLVQTEEEANRFHVLRLGAVDVLPKPKAGGDVSLLSEELARKIRILKGVFVFKKKNPGSTNINLSGVSEPVADPPSQNKCKAVLMGASTGGPQAFLEIINSLPSSFPLPVFCVQHISTGFSESLVEWLNQTSKLEVVLVKEAISPLPGKIYFPKDDRHLVLENGKVSVSEEAHVKGHRPSVDRLFLSASREFKNQVLAVLLTGMGDDGAEGLLHIKKNGGYTIAQDESSSVVFGMPRVAFELGAAREVLPLNRISKRILELSHV
ncbi:chemotaxis-specific protein-glutamate methyltransferase CheB [Leptospira idonii]|uniref:Protein-glutamate methylesterase/protein-glutamine glutaminase n=1 Tax=Leptospira idonii TaxID=1193500 RepID=A0A4R9LVP8_9LEPT|nr:chemotaxis-specific protein-glutamate methyltransferase CheB [Leptospira idonii]TGN18324.1 chemotaxis-specific protein-glutamate methyltransferase CheB [Leptospira idonii]